MCRAFEPLRCVAGHFSEGIFTKLLLIVLCVLLVKFLNHVACTVLKVYYFERFLTVPSALFM